MKLHATVSIAFLLSSLVYAGCGAAAEGESIGTTGEAVTSSENLSGAVTKHSVTICPAGEQACRVEHKNGTCGEVCVPDEVACEAPQGHCPICDPAGGAPREGCQWDTSTCVWLCADATAAADEKAHCDLVPGPEPRSGCQWSATECGWVCPVCDPPPPPEKSGCQFDEVDCVWICA